MRKRLYIVVVLVLELTLDSCGVYSKYERPDVSFADSLYCDTLAYDSANISFITWQEFFMDSLLRRHIQTGLNNNSDLEIARLKVVAAEAVLQSSKMSFLPTVSLVAQGQLASYAQEKAAKTYSFATSVDWEIDIFAKLRNTKEASRYALLQSESYRQAVQTQLIATIANAYYTLLMLDQQLAISESTAHNWKENIRVLTELKRAGRANEAAILQANANEIEVEKSIVALRRQIKEQEHSMCSLMGITPSMIKRTLLSQQVFSDRLTVGVPLKLLGNRPDVKSAEYRLAQEFYITNVARSAFYPSINLSGIAGWANSGGGAITNPGSWLLNALGSVVQPLFNKGENRANLKIAEAGAGEAMQLFRQSLLDAGTDVNNALILCQSSKKRIILDRCQISTLEDAVRITQLLMRNSSTSYLEVLTAQQNLLKARLSEASDKYDEIVGIISLYHALGGGS